MRPSDTGGPPPFPPDVAREVWPIEWDLLLTTRRDAPIPLGRDGDGQLVGIDSVRDGTAVVQGRGPAEQSRLLALVAAIAARRGGDVRVLDLGPDQRLSALVPPSLCAASTGYSLPQIIESACGEVTLRAQLTQADESPGRPIWVLVGDYDHAVPSPELVAELRTIDRHGAATRVHVVLGISVSGPEAALKTRGGTELFAPWDLGDAQIAALAEQAS